jgi:uncharacterized protein (DUF697 family)
MIDKIKPFKKIIKTAYNTMSDKLSEERGKHADSIIRNHIIWSMGAGFIPVAIADVFAVSAVQLDMIRQLSKAYDLDFKETEGKALITALTGSTLARIGASAVKLIPGIGSVLGGFSMSILSGASTYALGEVFKTHFSTGGTFLDFDPNRMKQFYQEKFEKGKKVAQELKEQQAREKQAAEEAAAEIIPKANQASQAPSEKMATSGPIEKIKELAELRDRGVLTDEEFLNMKRKLIDDFNKQQ